MIKWLKSLFSKETAQDVSVALAPVPTPEPVKEVCPKCGQDPCVCVPEVVEEAPAPVVEAAPAPKAPKKTSRKKTTAKKSGKTCDFDKLTKTQLLAEAKHRGVAANASLSKAEILKRLKNG